MILKQVLIVDHENAESGEFIFKDGANLLISESNTQGKSSLLKTIYYAFGFKINKFPTDWKISKMSIKLDLHNEQTNEDIYILRHNDVYFVSGQKESMDTPEYTRWLSQQLGIDLKLINKQLNKITSVIYPSALITPFYVDQDDSWSGRLYSSTNELTMYKEVPERIFDYVLGISDDDEMKLKEKISVKQNVLSDTKTKRNNIKDAFMDYIQDLPADSVIDVSSINDIQKKNKESVDTLINLVNEANKKYIEYKVIRLKLQRKYDQARKSCEEYRSILKMYEDDYRIIKSICKHCKSELTKEQVSTRMEITSNIYQLKIMIASSEKEITSLEGKIDASATHEDNMLIEYSRLSNELKSTPEIKAIADYIDIASRKRSQVEFATMIQKLEGEMGRLAAEIDEYKAEEQELQKATDRRTSAIKKAYSDYITDLSIFMPKSNVSKMEFKKFAATKSSGVTDNQTYLGVYLVYTRLISEFGRYKLPFCIDSFIKNETADPNLDKMFEATEKYLWSCSAQSIFSVIQSNVDKYIKNSDQYNKVLIGERLLSNNKYQKQLQDVAKIIHI